MSDWGCGEGLRWALDTATTYNIPDFKKKLEKAVKASKLYPEPEYSIVVFSNETGKIVMAADRVIRPIFDYGYGSTELKMTLLKIKDTGELFRSYG